MNPETLAVARSAWKAMSRKPFILDAITGQSAMPAWMAVDMVQDVTDDRGEAITAIVGVAADELEAKVPAADGQLIVTRSHATAVPGYLRCLSIGEAEAHVGVVRHLAAVLPQEHFMLVMKYRTWAKEAERVIELCRDLCHLWPVESETEAA